jgi:desulfoferrodoxin (superoxide reductase-like protein)
MEKLGERVQTADWKQEKHVAAIECPSQVKSGELFEVKVSLGKAVAHPNTTEHHIRWIHALSLCNIHGLWESAKEIKVAT